MRVTIQFDAVVRPLLADWRRSLAANPLDRELLAETLLDIFRQRLAKTAGRPPGEVIDRSTDPPMYWSELTATVWLGYTIADTRAVFRRERLIRVVNLRQGRPPAAPEASPRT